MYVKCIVRVCMYVCVCGGGCVCVCVSKCLCVDVCVRMHVCVWCWSRVCLDFAIEVIIH